MYTRPHQRLVLAATGFVLAAALLMSSALAEPEGTKDLTIDQKQVADFVVPESDLKVTAWVDRQDDTYQADDTLKLFVKANRDAYVTVVDVGTSGKVLVLFPNKHASDNRILADKVLQIPGPDAPYDIRVAGPAGQELIKVIATTRPGSIIRADQLSELGPFQSYGGSAERLTKDLAIELKPNAPDAPGTANDAAKGAAATVHKVISIIAPQDAAFTQISIDSREFAQLPAGTQKDLVAKMQDKGILSKHDSVKYVGPTVSDQKESLGPILLLTLVPAACKIIAAAKKEDDLRKCATKQDTEAQDTCKQKIEIKFGAIESICNTISIL